MRSSDERRDGQCPTFRLFRSHSNPNLVLVIITMASSSLSFSHDGKKDEGLRDQVTSWLINEQKCVSVESLSWWWCPPWQQQQPQPASADGAVMSRQRAERLLHQVVAGNTGSGSSSSRSRVYQVTKCHVQHHEEVHGDNNDRAEVVPCTGPCQIHAGQHIVTTIIL
jgi:hypothetical protein